MREIKFRAWDAHEKKMITYFDSNFKLSINSETGAIFCAGYMIDGERINYTLMQFTGKNDITGKNIYEGDIVTWRNASGIGNGTGRVYFDIDATRYKVHINEYEVYDLYDVDYADIKVIGNIYENPELIEE